MNTELWLLAVACCLLVALLAWALKDNYQRKKINAELETSRRELYLSEQSLSAALEHANMDFWEYYPQEHSSVQGHVSIENLGMPQHMSNYPQSWMDSGVMDPVSRTAVEELHQKIDAGAKHAECDVHVRRKGSWNWMHMCYTTIEYDREQRPIKVVGSAYSIEREKELEQRYQDQVNYRNIMAKMARGYAKLNITQNRVVSAKNEPLGDIADRFASADEMLENMRSRIVEAARWEDIRMIASCTGLVKAFQQGIAHREYEFIYDFGGGSKPIWVNATIDLLENPTNGDLECFVYSFDINDRKEAELSDSLQLSRALLAAEKANAAKSEFLSMMSHEIRTPMNAILGFTNLAMAENMSDSLREYLKKINYSSSVLLNLINDILDMSRIERNKVEIVTEPVNVADFFKGLQDMVEPLFAKKGITFTQRSEGIVHPIVELDKLHSQQIYMNLLSNAAKFTQEGGEVDLVTRHLRTEGDRAYVEITLKDNGIGMTPEFIKHVYEPFEQEKDDRALQYAGTGLGMAITKHLIELMGGSIQVESEKNVGTTFTVYLSFKVADSVPAEPVELPAAEPQLSGTRVLLVEDQKINIEIAKQLLERAGSSVEVAENGQIGLKKFMVSPEGYYDVVLMDIRMPVLNGLEATRAIRALERNDAKRVPIIAMTANAFTTERDETREAGMNAHLTKPIEPKLMLATIATQIQQARQ